MVRKISCLIMLSFALAIGGLWGLRAQEQTPQKPQTPPTPATMLQTTSTTTSQVDLSGTYTGTFNCEAAGLVGDTTLTINGNEFTTADGRTGRITTSKTRGYTAVALQVNGTDATAPPTIVSLRGKKSGSRLTLTPIAGATQKCTFVPGRSAVARGRRNQRTPAATGTEVANPAATPVPVESPMPMQTPSPSPTPMPSPTPGGSPTPMPSPVPSPAPTQTPSPSPGEPTPSPSPTPSPTPTPSPSPSPSPRV
jgi:hypothetical protein